ncbi:MAG TPA: DICT sensory domain-containing protein [Nocardioidaceae bacterium]|nr:DICT sensory domain-containing protein [Nocardioidaceae bacterium]
MTLRSQEKQAPQSTVLPETAGRGDEPGPPPGLTIGELAERTGLAPATLRMWESRHGFPRPHRRASGHRRYDEGDVELVRQVVRRRDGGSRLDLAIAAVALAKAAQAEPPGAPSVFATLRRLHPGLHPQRLRKSTLLGMSWAIEDECCSRAEQPMIFGAFQKESYFRAAQDRWAELARVARSTMVFADFAAVPEQVDRTTFVHLPDDAPMRREWAVVCDAPDYPAMLTAWELPGQSTVPDRQRLFECIWTVEPAAVRNAARACAQVAQGLGHPEGAPLLYELADNPPAPPVELLQATSLLNRVVAYVDRTP